MQRPRCEEALALILKEDPRYPREAYHFLRHALSFTFKKLDKPAQGPARHMTGQELQEGIRLFALQEFGPMARTVLATWGITRTEDFGEIVFNLVAHGVLGKTDQDKKGDFANGYDFHDAFAAPFLPTSSKNPAKPTKRKRAPRNPAKKDPT